MTNARFTHVARLATAVLLAAAVGGCNTLTRLSEVGDGPDPSPIVNPTQRPGYKPVSLPMPAAQRAEHNPNSLWRSGARAFFKDNRANEVGDILTVTVNLSDKAAFDNKTERQRADSEDTNVSSFLGIEQELASRLPEAVNPDSLISFDDAHQTKGDGSIDRKEELELSVAAVVTQVLPNGNLVIAGRQEIRVNYELRELMITGVVRPEDIDPSNRVSHDKIAEMRMAYGGRGTLSDLQVPRWGTQIWDILFPF
jgi:flagellar L-ring protein precursor FlgH